MTGRDVCPHCGGSGRGTSFTRPNDPCGACGGTGKPPAPKPPAEKRDAEWLREVAQRIDQHEADAWRRMR